MWYNFHNRFTQLLQQIYTNFTRVHLINLIHNKAMLLSKQKEYSCHKIYKSCVLFQKEKTTCFLIIINEQHICNKIHIRLNFDGYSWVSNLINRLIILVRTNNQHKEIFNCCIPVISSIFDAFSTVFTYTANSPIPEPYI